MSSKAAATSFRQTFEASGIRDIALSIPSVPFDTCSGKDFERNVGESTCADIVVAAAVTWSESARIFGRLGSIDAKIEMMSSATAGLRISKDFRDLLSSGEFFSELPFALFENVNG